MELDRQFLHILAHMYLQQAKYKEALALFRFLRLHFSGDDLIVLSLVFCLFQSKRFEEALKVLDSLKTDNFTQELLCVYYFLKSKSLWELGNFQDSRLMLHNYLKYRKLEV